MITFASQTLSMNPFLKRSINYPVIALLLLVITAACDKDMSVMLDNSTTGDVGVSFVDSFTVNTSTVQLRDMPTAATGSILVGKAALPNSGSVSSTSYFQIGFSNFTNDIPQDAVFDSLNLVLKPHSSRYYFGDTTKIQEINVHQLSETLETKTITGGIQNQAIPVYVTGASLFSDQQFAYTPDALGTLQFNPRIRSIDTLDIRLNQTLGQNLFDLIKANDLRVSSNENFREYFKGLALVPGDDNTVAIAFNDTIQVKINYSYVGTDGFKRTGAKSLSIVDRNFQYNNIEYDRTGTAFETLSPDGGGLAASATGGLTYVQSGTGVVAKLQFPSLKEFLQDDNISVNRAELVVETSSPTNTMYGIPENLMLFVADHDGVPTSFLSTPYGTGIQQASYIPGNQMGGNGSYRFNMIVYLKNLKSSTIYDNTSLYLSTGTPALFSTLNTAFIATENEKPKIKLNILYTKFR